MTYELNSYHKTIDEMHVTSTSRFSSNQANTSALEKAILNANYPIQFNENESITVNGHTGIWLNKAEAMNWNGRIPLADYPINNDTNPEVIRKQSERPIICEQAVSIRL